MALTNFDRVTKGIVGAVKKKKKEKETANQDMNVGTPEKITSEEIKVKNPVPEYTEKNGIMEKTNTLKLSDIPVGQTLNPEQQRHEEQKFKQAQMNMPRQNISETITPEKQTLINSISNDQTLTEEERLQAIQDVTLGSNIKEAKTGIATGLATNVAGGAAAGAAAGLLTGGTLSLPGAVVGAAGAIPYTIVKNVQKQAQEDVAVSNVIITSAKKAMRKDIQDINLGVDPTLAVADYQMQVHTLLVEQARLKELTSNNLKEYLSDGKADMAKINSFFANEKSGFDMQLTLAIAKPNKNAMYYPETE